jgi:hypothetical protein
MNTPPVQTAPAAVPPITLRIVKAPGSRYTQADVEHLIGPELLKVAAKYKAYYRQLTPRQVYVELQNDQTNPLWSRMNTDPGDAMEAFILRQIGDMMRACRIEIVNIPEFKPTPLFESLHDTSALGQGGTGRASVVATDAFDRHGIAERVASNKIEKLRTALSFLKSWVTASPILPQRYRDLVYAVELALLDFESPIAIRQAAE